MWTAPVEGLTFSSCLLYMQFARGVFLPANCFNSPIYPSLSGCRITSAGYVIPCWIFQLYSHYHLRQKLSFYSCSKDGRCKSPSQRSKWTAFIACVSNLDDHTNHFLITVQIHTQIYATLLFLCSKCQWGVHLLPYFQQINSFSYACTCTCHIHVPLYVFTVVVATEHFYNYFIWSSRG